MTTYSDEKYKSALLKMAAAANHEKREIPCLFRELQDQTLRVEAESRPAAAAIVSVEYNDALFLGEITALAPLEGGKWRVEIQVEQILSGLQSLMNLRERLLGEQVSARMPAALCA